MTSAKTNFLLLFRFYLFQIAIFAGVKFQARSRMINELFLRFPVR